MPRSTFAEGLLGWEQLASGLTAHAAEVPYLAEQTATLSALIAEIKALNEQQETLKAQLQAVTQQLDGKVAEIRSLESRLRTSLKGHYGAKDEQLEAFGIKPTRPATRTKATASP